ncbi:MAG: hypothetical protein IRZ07_30840 [Microbispora sp.]|nr:hypothetical protein [Microbispora sp.]
MTPSTEAPTRDQAMANAARLLHTAEAETDRDLMERYTNLAEAWLGYASLLADTEQP